jgi:cell shape-determining protein MreD
MLPDALYHFKSALNSLLPFSADALHVQIGLFLFIAMAAIARNASQRFAIAWGVVLAICLAGELLDILYDLGVGNPVRWRNGVKDTVNTMLWPTVWAVISTQVSRRKAIEDTPGVARLSSTDLSGQPR